MNWVQEVELDFIFIKESYIPTEPKNTSNKAFNSCSITNKLSTPRNPPKDVQSQKLYTKEYMDKLRQSKRMGKWDAVCPLLGLRGGMPPPHTKKPHSYAAKMLAAAKEKETAEQAPAEEAAAAEEPTGIEEPAAAKEAANPEEAKAANETEMAATLKEANSAKKTIRDCPYCLEASQNCSSCSTVACRQYHLSTEDEGHIFTCRNCQPSVRGIEGPGPSEWRIPCATFLSPQGKLPVHVPSTPSKVDLGLALRVALDDPEVRNVMIDSLTKKMSSTPTTPKLNSKSLSKIGCPTRLFDDVIQVDEPFQSVQYNTDDVNDPLPSGHAEEPQLSVKVSYFPSQSVPRCVYMGTKNKSWVAKDLLNSFWLAPGENNKTVMIRANSANSFGNILEFMLKFMRLDFSEPILTLAGEVVSPEDGLSDKEKNCLFLIHDKVVPEQLRKHSGKLWECSVCGKSATKKEHFKDNRAPKKCVKGHNHKFLFEEAHNSTWGTTNDRYKFPYGFPEELKSSITPTPSTLPRCPPKVISSPIDPSKSPVAKKTPEVQGRLKEQLNKLALVTLPTSLDNLDEDWSAVRRSDRSSKKRIELPPLESEDLSESEEDWKPSNGESSESEEDLQPSDGETIENVGKERGKKVKRRNMAAEWEENRPDTDDEEEDSNEKRRVRRHSKHKLQKIMQRLNSKIMSAYARPDVWVPDERDEALLSELVISPLMQESSKWRVGHNDCEEWVTQLVLSGTLPKGNTKSAWLDIATTARLYYQGLKDLMGKLQANYQQDPVFNAKLIEGRLHLWQMVDYFDPHHINFPELICNECIRKIQSPNMQKFAFGGWKKLLQSCSLRLSSTAAQGQFEIPTNREDFSTLAEYYTKKRENEDQGTRNRLEKKNWIEAIIRNMEFGKHWGAFRGDIAFNKKDKDKYLEMFSGLDEPGDDAISMYLASKFCQDILKDILELADKGVLVDKKNYLRLMKGLCRIWHLKNGHRVEVWGHFLYESWIFAVKGPDAAFPYKMVKDIEHAEKQNIQDRDGVKVYVRPDPTIADPDDPDDPMNKGEEKDLLLGKVVEIPKHKTGFKYRCWIFLSKWDVLYGRAMDIIRAKFLTSLGKDPHDPKIPFFTNSKGESLIHTRCPSLGWTEFSLVNNCKSVTSHIARKLLSAYVANQKSLVLQEGREYLMCNSEQVNKDHYIGSLRKKFTAVNLAATYHDHLEGDNMDVEVPEGPLNPAQKEREETTRREIIERNRMAYLRREAKREENIKPTLQRFVTNSVKVAMIQAIIACKGVDITREGDMCDLFLVGNHVLNIKYAKAFLRMIHLLPPDMKCVEVLQNHLALFAELSPKTKSMRDLEWAWARKMLMSLKMLSFQFSVHNQNLVYNLALLQQQYPDEPYFLGNPLIQHAVAAMIAANVARDAKLTGRWEPIDIKEYISRMNARAQEALYKKIQPTQIRELDVEETPPELPIENAEPEMVLGPVTRKTIPGYTPKVPQNVEKGRGQKAVWTNQMKLQLLELYIIHAEDPLLRDPTTSGRATIKKQVEKLKHLHIMMADGTTETLDNWTVDHLAVILTTRGLIKGKGMLFYIDEVMKTQIPRSVHSCRSLIARIKKLALEDCE